MFSLSLLNCVEILTDRSAIIGVIWSFIAANSLISSIKKHINPVSLPRNLLIRGVLCLLYSAVFTLTSRCNGPITIIVATPLSMVLLFYKNPEIEMLVTVSAPILILLVSGILSLLV